MDFTVLENTRGVQVCMLVMKKQRGKDKMVEREESKQRRGLTGRGLEPDMIRLSLVRNLSEAVHLF
ncbi:hypothetical protein I79_012887 [Cricetulus griseus]|uniref:Uncharacterized protein n=1 Tax=Cricetulus griseus TaxID=10029 RepID=G3HQ00_CRIGR|nr:hypothetical protein I79_012887 [Cricetulus griseus]